MADSIPVPQVLDDLESIMVKDLIRSIEKKSGQASQLVILVGNDKYLVGDLTKRAGEYSIEMQDKYNDPALLLPSRKVINPHKNLEGVYKTFEALREAVEKPQEQTGVSVFFGEKKDAVYLTGCPENGYSLGVPAMNFGSAGGQSYETIGKIIFPLLQDGEPVCIDKIKS